MLLENVEKWEFCLSQNFFFKENSFVSLTMQMYNERPDEIAMVQGISCQRRNFCLSIIIAAIYLPKNINERVRDVCRIHL